MDRRPVGVFDSGLGGVSLLREAKVMLPNENYIYYGDNLNAPYGDKTEEEIARLSFACADFLVSKGVKAILLACNTATGISIKDIRNRLSIPVVSVEPAIKPACESEGDGKILMLATLATTKLERYAKLQARMIDPSRVINVPCPGLVQRIEQGIFEIGKFDDLLERFLSPYYGIKVDGIVLGCTHYVFIGDAIREFALRHFDGQCRLFDGNVGTVRQLGRILRKFDIENDSGNAQTEFYTSGDTNYYKRLFEMLSKRE